MSLKNTTNQTIALAAIAQSCLLVQQLATKGEADTSMLETSIASTLKIDSAGVIGIFGELAALKPGLEQLQQQITGRHIADQEHGRYAAQLVFLEMQLANRPEMLRQIKQGIEKAQAQAESFGILHENVVASLGDLYHNTISTIQPRIMVNGEQSLLDRSDIVDKIRALLLSGIRSALLWRQCGGSRWKFILFRSKLQDEITFLLSQI